MYIILINVSSTRIYPETPSTVECQVLLDSSRVANDCLFCSTLSQPPPPPPPSPPPPPPPPPFSKHPILIHPHIKPVSKSPIFLGKSSHELRTNNLSGVLLQASCRLLSPAEKRSLPAQIANENKDVGEFYRCS